MSESVEKDETWLEDMTFDEFNDYFEGVRGDSGFVKFDVSDILPYQRQVIVLPSDNLRSLQRTVLDVGKDKGYFDLPSLADAIGQTLIVLDKMKQGLIFQSSVDKSVRFILFQEDLHNLIRILGDKEGRPGSGDPQSISLPLGESSNENSDHSLLNLQKWGFDHIDAVVETDKVDSVVNKMDDRETLSGMFLVAEQESCGIVLVDHRKNRFAILTPMVKDWFVDLHYLAAMDLFEELKRLDDPDI